MDDTSQIIGAGTFGFNSTYINAPINAQKFALTLSFSGIVSNENVYPQWFGAVNDYSSDCVNAFLAAAKSSIHLKSIILALNFSAISFVLSVLPVSTIIISSTSPWTEFKLDSKHTSSFLTIIHILILTIV